jgi:cob(I)alamin adenosyltransferase
MASLGHQLPNNWDAGQNVKIYTKKGDEGFTSLLGARARKDDARVEALGAIDELNCSIGLARCEAKRVTHMVIMNVLQPIQEELFSLGSRVAGMGTGKSLRQMPSDSVERMENSVDALWQDMPPLHAFILPGCCELACRLHICRAVCRRAERAVVHLLNPTEQHPLYDPVAVPYLNRLSDLLFTLARLANRDAGELETLWQSGKSDHT